MIYCLNCDMHYEDKDIANCPNSHFLFDEENDAPEFYMWRTMQWESQETNEFGLLPPRVYLDRQYGFYETPLNWMLA